MELVGEEKRIQALFSEVRLADEQITPSFVGVWNRAQAKTARPQRAFNLAFVAATALLVCALVSLAWWVNHSQKSQPVMAVGVPPGVDASPANVVKPEVVQPGKAPESAEVNPPRSIARPRGLNFAARRQSLREAVLVAANRKAARDAKAIESWQSPTAALLDSSSDELLKSVPQLNQGVDELKSFLPSRPK